MNSLQEALHGIGLKSTDEIIKQKVDALQRLYGFNSDIAQIITFTLKRQTPEDLGKNITLSKIEGIFRNELIPKRNWNLECLKLFVELLNFDAETTTVFMASDLLKPEEILYFIDSSRSFDNILSLLLDQMVIPLSIIDGKELYLMIPDKVLRKGGKVTILVPSKYVSYIPLFIGKKGANVKQIVQYLADIMTDGKTMVITQLHFEEPGF